MQHPSRHFIYYLLSKRSLDVPGVVETLRSLYLPVPPDDAELGAFYQNIVASKKQLRLPPKFNPLSPDDRTAAFLREWGLRDIWANGPYMKAAKALLTNPGPRRMVCVLLLSALNIKNIAHRTRKRFEMSTRDMNPKVVQLFSHYFWNYDAVDRDLWARYLISWVPGRTDDMITALKAPRTAGGVALAVNAADQAGAGETPSIVIYSTAREYAFKMFMNHALGASHAGNTLGALQALDMIIKADNELDKRRGGGAELLEEFQRLESDYMAPTLPSFADIPGLVADTVIDVSSEEVQENE